MNLLLLLFSWIHLLWINSLSVDLMQKHVFFHIQFQTVKITEENRWQNAFSHFFFDFNFCFFSLQFSQFHAHIKRMNFIHHRQTDRILFWLLLMLLLAPENSFVFHFNWYFSRSQHFNWHMKNEPIEFHSVGTRKNCLHRNTLIMPCTKRNKNHRSMGQAVVVCEGKSVCLWERERGTHTQDTTRKRKTGHGRRQCVVCWSCHDVKANPPIQIHNAHSHTHTQTYMQRRRKIFRVPYTHATIRAHFYSQFQRYENMRLRQSNTTYNDTGEPSHSIVWNVFYPIFDGWMNVSFTVGTYSTLAYFWQFEFPQINPNECPENWINKSGMISLWL